MRYLLIALLFMATPALAFDSCFTGSWYETAGEGISIEVLSDDHAIGYWYGYGTEGNQRWYTLAFGENGSGKVRTTVNREVHDVGVSSLDAIDANTLLFVYDITVDVDDPPWCIGCDGSMVLRRLTQPVGCE